ncbi:MAG: hypothetical protein ACW99Q_10290 [Candidatus Kariarchaeaceae archaeon]|jgi:hypothetical protein
MTNNTFVNCYFTSIDILGFDDVEKGWNRNKAETKAALLTDLFNKVDRTIEGIVKRLDQIEYLRYGDGFIVYSTQNSERALGNMIEVCLQTISFLSNQEIPVRVAIIEDNFNINIPNNNQGATVSGIAWDRIRDLEKSLDWCGGVLVLEKYNGKHHSVITDLVNNQRLVKENDRSDYAKFLAPWKKGMKPSTDKIWFINWWLHLRRSKSDYYAEIDNWWVNAHHTSSISETQNMVPVKKTNTKEFLDYCKLLSDSAWLLFWSGNEQVNVEHLQKSSLTNHY